MYNKIFTKILDSSIWLEPDHTRLVWLTLIAAMDEDGYAQFASVRNLAHRARVPEEAARKAVETLEGPDTDSSDPDEDGRRIERVPGGWLVINAPKYRDLVTRHVSRERTRERVRRHRERKRKSVTPVTPVTSNDSVTQSEAYSETDTVPPLSPNGDISPRRSARGGKARKVRFPEEFTLTPELGAYAAGQLPEVDAQALFEKWRDLAIAKGWEYVDWQRAFQTYVRNCAPTSGHWSAGQYPRKAKRQWQ